MKVNVYLVVRKSGQKTPEGLDLTVVLDVKLTRLAAEFVAKQHSGEVMKLIADKEY